MASSRKMQVGCIGRIKRNRARESERKRRKAPRAPKKTTCLLTISILHIQWSYVHSVQICWRAWNLILIHISDPHTYKFDKEVLICHAPALHRTAIRLQNVASFLKLFALWPFRHNLTSGNTVRLCPESGLSWVTCSSFGQRAALCNLQQLWPGKFAR